MPMVSVIMPVFNAGDGNELGQAIQSILQQAMHNFGQCCTMFTIE